MAPSAPPMPGLVRVAQWNGYCLRFGYHTIVCIRMASTARLDLEVMFRSAFDDSSNMLRRLGVRDGRRRDGDIKIVRLHMGDLVQRSILVCYQRSIASDRTIQAFGDGRAWSIAHDEELPKTKDG